MYELILGREKPKVCAQQFVEKEGEDPTDGNGQHQQKYADGHIKRDGLLW